MKLNKQLVAVMVTASLIIPAIVAEPVVDAAKAVDVTVEVSKTLTTKVSDFVTTNGSKAVTSLKTIGGTVANKVTDGASTVWNSEAMTKISKAVKPACEKTAEFLKPAGNKIVTLFNKVTGKVTASDVYKNMSAKVSAFYTTHPTGVKIAGVVVGAAAVFGIYKAFFAKSQTEKNN